MESVTFRNRDMYWDIAATLQFPPGFDKNKTYPAIISAHPIGSCKEQTAGNVYGKALAEAGFVVIAFDRSTQGASGGEPRYIEDPTLAVEDFRHVVDYLVTLPYVDAERIGVLGICGGGGYALNSVMTERRLKAVASITGVNFGRLCREGFSGYDPIGTLEAMGKQRSAEMRGEALRTDNFLPETVEAGKQAGITDIDVLEATDYYRNRCVQASAGTRALFSHRAAAIGWDAFHLAEVLLTVPMIVVMGDKPGGGVKEQTAGTYARKLAENGFVSIAFDASYQGESTGLPRQLENPYIRTEDVSAVVDYLTTLPYVDAERIGGMGICAGAGYTANAAINDRRIKAVGTVSAVNIGSMFRNGWDNNVKDADATPYLVAGSNVRSADAVSDTPATMPLAPLRKEDAPNAELLEAWEYYHTPRAEHPNAPGYATARSLNQIITYDAFNKAEAFLTQPLQVVAGSVAGSKWMSDDLYARAASRDKAFHVVEGANHMSLYDVPKYVDEAVSVLAPFFKAKL